MAVKRRVILYIHTYISTRTRLVPRIDQVYQHHPTKNNRSTWTHGPGIQYVLTGNVSPYSPHQYLSIYRLKFFHDQRTKINIFPLFAVPWTDHYSNKIVATSKQFQNINLMVLGAPWSESFLNICKGPPKYDHKICISP